MTTPENKTTARAAFRLDNWPIRDVLLKLADAVDHLLRDHDCDMHGYEQVSFATVAARIYADLLQQPATSERCEEQWSDWLMELRRQHGLPGNPLPLPHNFHWAIAEQLAKCVYSTTGGTHAAPRVGLCFGCNERVPITVDAHLRDVPVGNGKGGYSVLCGPIEADAATATGTGEGGQRESECFCGTELEAGLCPNGHDPVWRSGELVDEVQRRMDVVVEAAVEWHQSGRDGDGSWFDKSEVLSAAINSLLELRSTSPAPVAEAPSGSCLACGAPTSDPYCAECTEQYRAMAVAPTPSAQPTCTNCNSPWKPTKNVITSHECGVCHHRENVLTETLKRYHCSCGAACTADEYLVHYFELGHDRGEDARPDAGAVERLQRALSIRDTFITGDEAATGLSEIARFLDPHFTGREGRAMTWREIIEHVSDINREKEEAQEALSTARANAIREAVRDAGAILVANEGGSGARIEIRFVNLRDAQRLRKTLIESRVLQSLLDKKEGEDGPTIADVD